MNDQAPWIGKKVPLGWNISPFKRLVEICNGRDHKTVEEIEGYPVYGSGGIFAFASDYLYDGEAILLGRKGTIDKPLYVNGKFWTVDTMYWSKIRAGACGRFAYYAATTIPFDYYTTSTALPSMTKGTLNAHLIATPSLERQKAIANFLDRETARIDQLIEKKQMLLSLTDVRTVSRIESVLTKGLGDYSDFKPSGIPWLGNIPSNWNLMPLRHLVKISTGSRDTQDRIDDAQYPFFVRSQTIERIDSYALDTEAVLTSGDGAGVGKIFHHYKGKFDFHQRVYAFTDFKHVTARYFYYFLSAFFNRQMTQHSAKSTVDSVRMPFLKGMVFTVPSITEQKQITSILDKECLVQKQLNEKLEISIEKLKELRFSLVSAAVSGQLDIDSWKKCGKSDRRMDKVEQDMNEGARAAC